MDKMIEKARDDIKPYILADLFKGKLPKEVARTLVALNINVQAETKDDLKKMAEAAEKLYEFEKEYLSPKVCGISSSQNGNKNQNTNNSQKSNQNDPIDDVKNLKKRVNDLEGQVKHLVKVVDSLLGNSSNGNSGEKNGSKSKDRRSRSRTPRRSIDFQSPDNKGKCYYHIVYGDKTYRCTHPCIDSDKPLAPMPERKQKEN